MNRLSIACGVLVLGVGAGSAFAADLPVKAPFVPAPVFSWTGPYIGVNLGYSWGSETVSGTVTPTTVVAVTTANSATVTTTTGTPVPLFGGGSLNGVLGGGQLGYNWQVTNWLVGLEGDFQGTGERRTISVCAAAGCPAGSVVSASSRLSWFGTDRVRLGYLPVERVILYGTAGLAYGSFSSEATPIAFAGPASLRAGWTAGGGVETALDDRWSFKFEYLYMDFNNIGNATGNLTTQTVVGPIQGVTTTRTVIQNFAFSGRFTDNVVRIGFNYRFGAPAPAVVAKY